MKRLLGLVLLALVGVTPPATSAALVETTTVVRVQPANHTFHNGDPIRVCYGTFTETVFTDPVHLSIQLRPARPDTDWKVVGVAKQHANKIRCSIGQITVAFEGGDLLLRVVTLRGKTNDWSVSRLIRLEVQ